MCRSVLEKSKPHVFESFLSIAAMYYVPRVPEIVVTGRQALAKLSSLPIDYDVVDGRAPVTFYS